MLELQHRVQPPAALQTYLATHPNPTTADFDSPAFKPVKQTVKAALHQDQAGLCVYCERPLAADKGQVEHIKPKGGPNAHPHLCFTYKNYAHSCINNQTCGQKKKHGLLPIEPGPHCNAEWTVSTSGTIEPLAGLTRARSHAVRKTRDMLGLNADTALVEDRKSWLRKLLVIEQEIPGSAIDFLSTSPFRHILATEFLRA